MSLKQGQTMVLTGIVKASADGTPLTVPPTLAEMVCLLQAPDGTETSLAVAATSFPDIFTAIATFSQGGIYVVRWKSSKGVDEQAYAVTKTRFHNP